VWVKGEDTEATGWAEEDVSQGPRTVMKGIWGIWCPQGTWYRRRSSCVHRGLVLSWDLLGHSAAVVPLSTIGF